MGKRPNDVAITAMNDADNTGQAPNAMAAYDTAFNDTNDGNTNDGGTRPAENVGISLMAPAGAKTSDIGASQLAAA